MCITTLTFSYTPIYRNTQLIVHSDSMAYHATDLMFFRRRDRVMRQDAR